MTQKIDFSCLKMISRMIHLWTRDLDSVTSMPLGLKLRNKYRMRTKTVMILLALSWTRDEFNNVYFQSPFDNDGNQLDASHLFTGKMKTATIVCLFALCELYC